LRHAPPLVAPFLYARLWTLTGSNTTEQVFRRQTPLLRFALDSVILLVSQFKKANAMLKGLDPILTADLLYVLKAMGHGDDIVLCDRNHPASTLAAKTTHGKLLTLFGADLKRAAEAVLSLFPLDTFVDEPVMRMKVVGNPNELVPIHHTMQEVVNKAEARPIKIGAYERFDFYDAAARSFAIVQTSDPGPYGCFIFRKGVI
jgi:L-fucose mutarotase